MLQPTSRWKPQTAQKKRHQLHEGCKVVASLFVQKTQGLSEVWRGKTTAKFRGARLECPRVGETPESKIDQKNEKR